MSLTMRDYATDAQLYRIARLLEERTITSATASKLLRILEDCPGPEVMGHNADINKAVRDRIEREP